MMNCAEIRSAFVNFYNDLGFQLLPPAPMLHPSIPMSFVMSAGLVQVETSLAKAKNRSGNKFVLVQNCFRHFDLKSVGTDDVHLSLFEMPGAFVFGKDGKQDTISNMWHLATEELGIDPERIWATYFKGNFLGSLELPKDELAYNTWLELALPKERLIGLDLDNNYWVQGNGVQNNGYLFRNCGSYTELFYDRGAALACGVNCKPGCGCVRFIEFANSLFISHEYNPLTQTLIPLENPFHETVIGTERVSMILQGVESVFDTQPYRITLNRIESYVGNNDLPAAIAKESLCVIVDHFRALYFLVADGAPPPGKNGRSRIVKLLIRGVITRQVILGISSTDFLPMVINLVVKTFADSTQFDFETGQKIELYFEKESQRYYKTIKRGEGKIRRLLIENNGQTLSKSQIIFLEKKWGMPSRLTKKILYEMDFFNYYSRNMEDLSMEAWVTELHAKIKNEGVVILEADKIPLSKKEWDILDAMVSSDSLPYEKVEIGDTDDSHYLYVCRFMTDVQKPEFVNTTFSQKVIKILESDKMMGLYKQLLGANELYVRRCQINVIPENGFVGYHIDNEANPDYLVAIIIQFSYDFEGGEYLVHHKTLGKKYYKPSYHSMLISRGDLPHEVTKVIQGERKTLVYFLAPHFGENRRWLKESLNEKT